MFGGFFDTFSEGSVDRVIYRDYIVNLRAFIYCILACVGCHIYSASITLPTSIMVVLHELLPLYQQPSMLPYTRVGMRGRVRGRERGSKRGREEKRARAREGVRETGRESEGE